MRQHSGAALLEVRRRPGEEVENSWGFRLSRWFKGGNEDLRAHCQPVEMAEKKAKTRHAPFENERKLCATAFSPLKTAFGKLALIARLGPVRRSRCPRPRPPSL